MLKCIILKGFGKTNTATAEYDKKTVPSGKEWTLMELRFYSSRAVKEVEMYLERMTVRVYDVNALSVQNQKRPYPVDTKLVAGEELRFLGVTDGTSTDMLVEVIYDEVIV